MSKRSFRSRRIPLLWQIFVPNALILLTAGGILALSPATVSRPVVIGEVVVIVIGLTLMVLLDWALIRRAVAPVERLTRVMRAVDPLHPGQRVSPTGGSAEISELAAVFNAMIERLERERRESAQGMLAAQEAERGRLARELHDEIGQSITGLMLQVGHTAAHAPEELQDELGETREAARSLSDELRDIVRRLRPEALDDLGLGNALIALIDQFSDQTGIKVRRRLEAELPGLSAEEELVIYRVAQEGLTNVARHAGASEVEVVLEGATGGATLRISDDGRGLDGASPGAGIRGMRERALLIGAELSVDSDAERGVALTLDVPTHPV